MKINNIPQQQDTLPETTNTPWVAIVGNPNCGKTALFNRLTGLHQKVGNYPGITVEKKSGWLKGRKILLRDLPGTYSLNPKSIDEKIVADTVQSWRKPENRPRAVIVVVDATNLTRNIYLALQILDWNLPTIIALNMWDEVEKQGIHIDVEGLKERLRAWAVIPTSAKLGIGIAELVHTIEQIPDGLFLRNVPPRVVEIDRYRDLLQPLIDFLGKRFDRLQHDPLIEALRLLGDKGYINYLTAYLEYKEIEELQRLLTATKEEFIKRNIPFRTLEQSARYGFIDLYLSDLISREDVEKQTISEKIDHVLTHRFFGPILMVILLLFIFNAIFSWAQYPMDWIQAGNEWLAAQANQLMPDGLLKSLVIDGIIAGVGSILTFFPQILILVFFLGLLEDSGYMSRMAFMMDRLLSRLGLHGRSVLPLLSGFACAIPGIIAARTIDDRRTRIVTILLVPLMSCSARLPVYTLLIAAFIPNVYVFGFLSLQGLVFTGIYFLGMFTAIFVALIFKKLYPPRSKQLMMMELPPYRIPLLSSIFWQMYERGKSFLTTAGSIILAISVVLWFLASFPKPRHAENLTPKEQIEYSYAGRLGKTIEPVIKPLGFDWKIGVGLVTSFAAREVIISTLSTLYNLEQKEGGQRSLADAMRQDHYPDGRPVFSILVALSLMIFYVYAAQCMATFAIIKKETNSWRWPFLMVGYMTTLAYVASFVVYQGGKLLGF